MSLCCFNRFIVFLYFLFICFRKAESDEDHKKRQPPESLDDIFEEAPFTKKARLDLPLVRSL